MMDILLVYKVGLVCLLPLILLVCIVIEKYYIRKD